LLIYYKKTHHYYIRLHLYNHLIGVDLVPKEGAPGSATANFAAITHQHLAMLSDTVRELATLEMMSQNNFLTYKLSAVETGESSPKRMRY
jgi:hypothetical protein